MRGREQKRPRAMVQIVDQVAASAYIAAKRANGLRECSHLYVHPRGAVEVIHTAATVAPQHPAGMRVVNHHDRAILVAEVAELVDGANIAIHRKHSIRDDQLTAGFGLDLLQQFLCMRGVLMAEDLDLRAREPRTINDAGMIQLIRDNEVFLPQNARDRAGIGCKSRLEDNACLDTFEGS